MYVLASLARLRRGGAAGALAAEVKVLHFLNMAKQTPILIQRRCGGYLTPPSLLGSATQGTGDDTRHGYDNQHLHRWQARQWNQCDIPALSALGRGVAAQNVEAVCARTQRAEGVPRAPLPLSTPASGHLATSRTTRAT